MHSADIIIAVNDGFGGCKVNDYWSTTFAKPLLDTELGGSSDLTATSCVIEDGYLNASFTRPYVTGDDLDRSFLPDTPTLTLIYAYHPSSDGLQYHGAARRGVRDISFQAASADSAELLETEFDETTKKELTDGYTVWWKILGSSDATAGRRKASRKLLDDLTELEAEAEVIIKLQRKSTGWMGFGIDPADASVNGMQDTDMYIAWIDPDSTVHIMDAWSVGFMPPEFDSDQGGESSILAYAGEERDGITTVVFKRKVDTGDPYDRVIKAASQDIVFAYGEGDGLPAGGHGPCCRGKDKMNWRSEAAAEVHPSGPKLPNENLKKTHAWLMILGWAILCLLGILVSHMGRHWKSWKMLHIALECAAVLLSFIGQIVGFSYTEGAVRGAHGVLSIGLLLLVGPQMWLGYSAHKKDNFYWTKLHRGMGYFVAGMACWQIWLGMKLYGVDTRLVQCYYAWLISVGTSFHFGADSVSLFELRTHLAKKGFEVDDGTAKKQRRNSAKSKALEKGADLIGAKLGQKQAVREGGEDRSFSIKASDNRSRTQTTDADESSSLLKKKSENQMDAHSFLEACAVGKQWTVIDQKVYDMSKLIDSHPGGPDQIIDIIGKDGTDVYNLQHATSESAHRMLRKTLLADLADPTSE